MTDLLGRIAPRARLIAGRGPSHLFEDAVQEGLIAAWQAEQKFPGKPDVYYKVVAQNAVRDVARGRPFTGQPSRNGKRPDAIDGAGPLPDFDEHGEREPSDIKALEALEAAESDWQELHRAVAQLPARERLMTFLRFWEDHDWAHVADEVGITEHTATRIWSRTIKPQLKEALADSADGMLA